VLYWPMAVSNLTIPSDSLASRPSLTANRVLEALVSCDWSRTRAADLLFCEPQHIRYWIGVLRDRGYKVPESPRGRPPRIDS
jgi:hypothetical protein